MLLPDGGLDGAALILGILRWLGPLLAGLIGFSMGWAIVKSSIGLLIRDGLSWAKSYGS